MMNPLERTLTISRVASAAGVNIETVRYYQRRGLVKEPPKPRQGYRIYTPETVDRLRFIKRSEERRGGEECRYGWWAVH